MLCSDGCVPGDACGACLDVVGAPFGSQLPYGARLCSNQQRVVPPVIKRWLQEMQAKQNGYGKENLSEQQDSPADSTLPGAGVFAETVFQKLCTVLKSMHMPRLGKRKSPICSWNPTSDFAVVEYCWRKAIDASHEANVRRAPILTTHDTLTTQHGHASSCNMRM